jgi:hypothetical protein
MRNKILIILFIMSLITCIISGIMLDSESNIPVIAAIISGVYICMFGGANFDAREKI